MHFFACSDTLNIKSFIVNTLYTLKNVVYSIFKTAIAAMQWSKRKILLIIAAFMIGMSDVILEEDKTVNTTQNQTEHQDRKHEDDPTE
ncbi:MAG: hypothetical protein QM485_09725 [Flavobacteriaceae bacterium]